MGGHFARMQTVAKILGQLLLAISGLWGLVLVATLVNGDRTAALGSTVLAGAFALPGWLLHSYAVTAERRQQAETLIRSRDRFTIEEVARVLRTSMEHAHVFIAGQISKHGLGLVYQQQTRGYARHGLPETRPPPPPQLPAPVAPVAGPCPSCGSTAAPTETGFCPTCGARAPDPRVRV